MLKKKPRNAFVGKRHCWNTHNGKARTNIYLCDALCAMGVEDRKKVSRKSGATRSLLGLLACIVNLFSFDQDSFLFVSQMRLHFGFALADQIIDRQSTDLSSEGSVFRHLHYFRFSRINDWLNVLHLLIAEVQYLTEL